MTSRQIDVCSLSARTVRESYTHVSPGLRARCSPHAAASDLETLQHLGPVRLRCLRYPGAPYNTVKASLRLPLLTLTCLSRRCCSAATTAVPATPKWRWRSGGPSVPPSRRQRRRCVLRGRQVEAGRRAGGRGSWRRGPVGCRTCATGALVRQEPLHQRAHAKNVFAKGCSEQRVRQRLQDASGVGGDCHQPYGYGNGPWRCR